MKRIKNIVVLVLSLVLVFSMNTLTIASPSAIEDKTVKGEITQVISTYNQVFSTDKTLFDIYGGYYAAVVFHGDNGTITYSDDDVKLNCSVEFYPDCKLRSIMISEGLYYGKDIHKIKYEYFTNIVNTKVVSDIEYEGARWITILDPDHLRTVTCIMDDKDSHYISCLIFEY